MKPSVTMQTESPIGNVEELDAAIQLAKQRIDEQELEIQEQFRKVMDEMKLKNLIGNVLNEVGQSVALRQNLFKVAAGLGAGYLSRRFLGNPSGKMLGRILQYGVAALIARESIADVSGGSGIKKIGGFLKKLLRRRHEKA